MQNKNISTILVSERREEGVLFGLRKVAGQCVTSRTSQTECVTLHKDAACVREADIDSTQATKHPEIIFFSPNNYFFLSRAFLTYKN